MRMSVGNSLRHVKIMHWDTLIDTYSRVFSESSTRATWPAARAITTTRKREACEDGGCLYACGDAKLGGRLYLCYPFQRQHEIQHRFLWALRSSQRRSNPWTPDRLASEMVALPVLPEVLRMQSEPADHQAGRLSWEKRQKSGGRVKVSSRRHFLKRWAGMATLAAGQNTESRISIQEWHGTTKRSCSSSHLRFRL